MKTKDKIRIEVLRPFRASGPEGMQVVGVGTVREVELTFGNAMVAAGKAVETDKALKEVAFENKPGSDKAPQKSNEAEKDKKAAEKDKKKGEK